MRIFSAISCVTVAFAGAALADVTAPSAVEFGDYGQVSQSLTGVAGDPAEGAVLMNKGSGNCIACHQVSDLSQLDFQGNVGPSLDGVASRWEEADLRGIVVNAKNVFPETVMPSFYRTEGYIRPGEGFTGKAVEGEVKPLLTAQQVEDVVAYLLTLKEE